MSASRGDSVNRQDGSGNWRWLVGVPVAIVVVAGVLWSSLWYWAAGTAEHMMTGWRDREARAGRTYNCATISVGGFPTRFAVTCGDPSVEDRRAGVSMAAKSLSAVSQVFEPTVVSGQIDPPVTIGPAGGAPAATMEFASAHGELRAMPGTERLAVAVDHPLLKDAASGVTMATADQMELRSRFAADGTDGHPILNLEIDVHDTKAPAVVRELGHLGPLAGDGADVNVVARLHGLSELSLKPLSQQLREIQAAGGRLEVTNARLQQGELIVGATGALSLTPRGALSGDLELTVVDISRLIALLDLERMLPREVRDVNRLVPALNRLLPGLGGVVHGTETEGIVNIAVAVLGGRPAEFEGRQAMTMTVHFDDGAAQIGKIRIGEVPPLY